MSGYKTRADCINEPRPCCQFLCKYNLALDVYGSVDELDRRVTDNIFRASDFAFNTNCMLDVIDKHPEGLSNIEVAKVLQTNKETVRLRVLDALTQGRMYLQDLFENSDKSLEFVESFMDDNYSPHEEDVRVVLDKFPKLSYTNLCQLAEQFNWKKRLKLSESDWEVISDPLSFPENNEVVQRYNLTAIPYTYSVSKLAKMIGFSDDMIEVWIAKGLEFLVGRDGECMIERAAVLDFLETHGSYHYKVIHNSNAKTKITPQTIQELKLNHIVEINDIGENAQKSAKSNVPRHSFDEDSIEETEDALCGMRLLRRT